MKQNKKIGIGIATLLVFGVVFLTMAKDKKTNNTARVNDMTTATTDSSPIPQNENTKSVQLPPPPKSFISSLFGDEEGSESSGDEEGERGSTSSAPTTTSKVSVTPSKTTTSTSPYKNGTYAVTATYMSPGGMDGLGVSVTIAGGVVTATSATPEPGNGTSARYEDSFAANYQPSVIGKSIATLAISNVAGASLTTNSFNQALVAIRAQAKV